MTIRPKPFCRMRGRISFESRNAPLSITSTEAPQMYWGGVTELGQAVKTLVDCIDAKVAEPSQGLKTLGAACSMA